MYRRVSCFLESHPLLSASDLLNSQSPLGWPHLACWRKRLEILCGSTRERGETAGSKFLNPKLNPLPCLTARHHDWLQPGASEFPANHCQTSPGCSPQQPMQATSSAAQKPSRLVLAECVRGCLAFVSPPGSALQIPCAVSHLQNSLLHMCNRALAGLAVPKRLTPEAKGGGARPSAAAVWAGPELPGINACMHAPKYEGTQVRKHACMSACMITCVYIHM